MNAKNQKNSEAFYKVGDYFTGVLLETFKDKNISRPRVRPLGIFPQDIRVEFPRKLRENYPLGTKFRAMVKVAQKTNKKTNEVIGVPYLVATDKSIDLVMEYSPIKQIYAIPIKDRLYEYVLETDDIIKNPLMLLRQQAYKVSDKKSNMNSRNIAKVSLNKEVHSYIIQRSSDKCEGCYKATPFTTKNAIPYLIVINLLPISGTYLAEPQSLAALCPNCSTNIEKAENRIEFSKAIIEKIVKKEKLLGNLN